MSPAYTLPAWLTDEELLRDEAVLFGLSEARADEKIASIQLAFAALTAPLEKQIEQQQKAMGELNLLLETADNQPIQLPGHSQAGWPVGLFVAGLCVSLFLCAGTYLSLSGLAGTQLALLMAGLAGISGCAASLLVSQAHYKHALSISRLNQSQVNDAAKSRAAEKADWRRQQQTALAQLYQAEALLNQHNAHRDLLIRLFESEFDLARSLRHQVRDRYVDL